MSSVDNYFQTARYTDEAIEQVFNQLKELGLYDNTMIVLYGDHYGISDNHNKAMGQVMGKEITPYESANLQRVPLFIHVPGMQGGTNHTYGGQTDLLPTLLHLLGIDTKNLFNLVQIYYQKSIMKLFHLEMAILSVLRFIQLMKSFMIIKQVYH